MSNRLVISVEDREKIREEFAVPGCTLEELALKWNTSIPTIRNIVRRLSLVDRIKSDDIVE